MAKKSNPASSAVMHPLDPTIMTEIGGLKTPPPAADDFDPGADRTAHFRIWTCYGHRSGSNRDMGSLRIDRKAEPDGQRLTVRQTVLNSQGKRHTIGATVRCKTDALASPGEWTLTSTFSGAHMDGLPAFDTKETGRINGGTWETSTDGARYHQEVAPPVTGDWCLFEAVQRLPFREAAPLRFHVLEGLSVLKKDHRLWYGGKRGVTWGSEKRPLHRFCQVGRGVYPYEYWLDDRHRLLLVTTGPRACILDPQAAQGADA
ncbi:MAG TPA: hypothetical protein VMW94_07130 [Actinomycetes bacterium]|nr:hypothetical protein [Actinomycetes bacterium]